MNKNMSTITYSSGSYTTYTTLEPKAYVTSGRDRQKIYNVNSIYLANNQEFEIEIFNPSQTCYLAKISINGKSISNRGIIINPGERVFLERFIDKDTKFLFKTYDIENRIEAKNAIANNGLVQVEFFSENVTQGTVTISSNADTGNIDWGSTTNASYHFTTNTFNSCTTNDSIGMAASINEDTLGSNSLEDHIKGLKDSIETGRVNEGGKSDQGFEEGSGSFSNWSSYTVTYKILPISQQPIKAKDIRNYCPECRTRIRKSNWKFCPSCGEKL